MWTLLYRLGIGSYGLLLRLFALWHPKARLWVQGRRSWYERLRQSFTPVEGKVIWFHCASLGEFEQGRPVMERFKREHPDWQLVVTFFSPSGYEVRKHYAQADYVGYLPLDTPRNARRFLEVVRPTVAVFVKYEFWYYFLRELHRGGVPTYLVSGIFRPEQAFFKGYGKHYRRWLLLFEALLVQDERSRDLLASHGITQGVEVVGDTRFDRVEEGAGKTVALEKLEGFAAGEKLLVAGSIWGADAEYLTPIFDTLPEGWKCVIVPHEIHESEIEAWLKRYEGNAVRYTAPYTPAEWTCARYLVVDTVGLLFSIYHYGQLAYVGGGFGVGIHNTLEPAAFGLPVLFGPHYTAFREALDLLELGGAQALSTQEAFQKNFSQLFEDEELRAQMGRIARDYVFSNVGASERVCSRINAQLCNTQS